MRHEQQHKFVHFVFPCAIGIVNLLINIYYAECLFTSTHSRLQSSVMKYSSSLVGHWRGKWHFKSCSPEYRQLCLSRIWRENTTLTRNNYSPDERSSKLYLNFALGYYRCIIMLRRLPMPSTHGGFTDNLDAGKTPIRHSTGIWHMVVQS